MKKIVKNKKKRKKYAIERTKKIAALNPKIKFHKAFLFKTITIRKLNYKRSNLIINVQTFENEKKNISSLLFVSLFLEKSI